MRALSILGVALLLLPVAAVAQKRAITFEDFSAVRVVNDPQVSPDGRSVLYAVRTTDLAGNRRTTRTYLVPSTGGSPRAWPDDTTNASEARWSPDGARVAFTSRGVLYVARADGSARVAVARPHGGASGAKWSPTGQQLLYTARVYPACGTDACNADSAKARETAPSQARVIDRLMYRHWNAWEDGTRSHLFVVSATGGQSRDLVPGQRMEVPPAPFGGAEAYNWSPDGQEIAYTAKLETADEAWNTNLDVYTVSADGGVSTLVTGANKGADQNPVYSPDGRWLAYSSQRRAGFEADKWRLMLMDRRTRSARELLPRWDRNADAVHFADNSTVLIETGDEGRTRLYRAMIPAAFGSPVPAGARAIAASEAATPTRLVSDHNSTGFSLAAGAMGRTLVWTRDAIHLPPEIWTGLLTAGGVTDQQALTHENDALVASLDMPKAEDFRYAGAGGTPIHGFIVKPPMFDASRKTPVLLLIHGGPQGAWLDSWGSRWNFALFAANGAAVIALNPRGSTTYGQKLTDEVSKDWGGKVYTDLMLGLDAALARNRWMDSTRMGAAGGSFGGYMVNWIAGHNRRFKALASHAGVFNLEAMAGATEELWFTEYEFGGPWWNRTAMNTQYRRFSPHLAAGNFRTPTLVLHGELDFRVPFTEGVSLFTAMQRQGVPSRFVAFPDEGHWITRPANQQLWWREMNGWFARYLQTPRQ